MACTETEFNINQGSSWSVTLEYKEPDGTTPIDLTDYKARMQIRNKIESKNYIIELNTENGKIKINPLIGEIILELLPDDTKLLNFNIGVYDLDLIAPDGTITTIIRGNINLCKEVTR